MIGGRNPTRTLLLGAVLAVALPPASAGAHGGSLLGAADAGPYRVQLMAAQVTRSSAGPAIDFTAYVQEAATGRPVEDAQVRMVVEIEGTRRSLPVQRIGNGYEAIARVPSSGDVYAYPVRVDVRGTAGQGMLAVTPPSADGPPTLLIAGTVAVLLGSGGLVLRVRRRRSGSAGPRRTSSPDEW